ncbi:2-amino-4-hydroxy-6-hydroxymethyldihydropteridine diphosphokinase [Deferribacter thermophilus]|uniref:2-amino-4-hydroxy-6- hydroxymethyldihydropteridine diphosphokinase n=1 Tax=Deferribacter thermophilus TaxID=53573 RepID=UPI003C2AA13D
MNKVILSLGSNVGDRVKNLYFALSLLEKKQVLIQNISSIYKSESLLKDGQREYFNMIVIAFTNYEPLLLLHTCKDIEEKMGRKKVKRWGERVIDIDIIDFNSLVIKTKDLCVPHIEMVNRSFVLYPLYQVFKDYRHPIFKKNVKYFIDELTDDLNIKRVGDLRWP